MILYFVVNVFCSTGQPYNILCGKNGEVPNNFLSPGRLSGYRGQIIEKHLFPFGVGD
jgi:hypothetical protein